MPQPETCSVPLSSVIRAVDAAFLGSQAGIEAYGTVRDALLASRPMTLDEISKFEECMRLLELESDELVVDLRMVA